MQQRERRTLLGRPSEASAAGCGGYLGVCETLREDKKYEKETESASEVGRSYESLKMVGGKRQSRKWWTVSLETGQG